ncbi:MAG: flagellar biosynthetic protein FlhB [Pirellulaceae bacterium]|jgi:flagellar biosynthetic protein FlhB
MPEQFGDKQYDATPHRRQKAREQGQVAKSQDLTSAILLIAALLTLMWLGQGIGEWFGWFARQQLGNQPSLALDQVSVNETFMTLIDQLARLMLPLMGILLLAAIASNLGQIGFLFLPNKISFDASRISIFAGLKRLFAMNNFVRLGFGLFKIGVIATVGGISVFGDIEQVMAMTSATPMAIGAFLVDLVLWTCLKIGVALLILALMDYAYQLWKYEEDLKMTHQEMKDEIKQQQGDPQMAARRRAVQRQLVLNRINSGVPKADVVVTNPTELAIAIQYDHDTMAAPIVVAKGAGVLAQRIRRMALEHGIPIVERKELAQALYKQADVNQQIPADQYAAMAEVLKYVYELQGRTLPTMDAA